MDQTDSIIDSITKAAKKRDPHLPLRRWFLADEGANPASFLSPLAGALRSMDRSVIHFDLPSGRFDAGEHLLGQLCQGLDVDRLPRASFSPKHTIHNRINWIARDFGPRSGTPLLLLSVPGSWLRQIWDLRRTLPDTSRNILGALLNHTSFDAVVVSTRQPSWLRRIIHAFPEPLPEAHARLDVLRDERRWKSASGAARRLASALPAETSSVQPRHLELGVACCVLGYPEARVAKVLLAEAPARKLIEMARRSLLGKPEWQPVMRRIALPRFPVPRELLEHLAGPMSEPERAFADCFIHEEHGQAKADEVLRQLVDAPGGDPEANARLAEHYRALDGVSDPESAIRAMRVVAWLERIHHLGHAGDKGIEALEDITPLSRMSSYELAWSLSYEFKEHELAARIYNTLAEEKPDDAYSHHYWAWNLDQIGKDFKTVRQEYQRAISIEPDNPWYNSRYITFLRDNGFQSEAREAFREALPIVSSSKWAKMPDFAEQFHRWVARSALDAGDLVLAHEALGSLSSLELDNNPKLAPLREELEYLSDIERLGEPVYPLGAPAQKRWKEPLLLPKEFLPPGGAQKIRLLAFYPGRVAVNDGDQVTLVLADPGQDPPALFTLELSVAELREMGGEAPRPGRFLELGHYEGNVTQVRYHTAPKQFDRSSFDDSLRHLRKPARREGV